MSLGVIAPVSEIPEGCPVSMFSRRLRSLALARITRMWIWAMLALGLGTAAFGARSQSSVITPSAVEQMIDKYGARHTIEKLTNSPPKREFGDYDIVLSGVSSGDHRWLALVPKLKAGTDAATSLALVVSVAEALPRNPKAVLRLIKADPSWRRACTYPMIEPTKAEERIYFSKAIPAVRLVRDPDVQSVKRACLADLVEAQRS